jgi:DNA-3-methyladenine glycosylase II
MSFSTIPQGPFVLARQAAHFGGWPRHGGDLVLAFPLEGVEHAAAVALRQEGDRISGAVHGCPPALAAAAWQQALCALSLDADGSRWPEVGERDARLGALQRRYAFLRPVLFHSPYEAAAAFVLGHRISMVQGRALRARLAAQLGEQIEIDGAIFPAFPSPARLLEAPELAGVPAVKAERLRAIARAACAGVLDRARLRSLTEEAALRELQELPGIGPFFAQGILKRGAGVVDAVSRDPISLDAVSGLYGEGVALERAAENWRPYRMWANVLLHVWARGEGSAPRGGSEAAGGGIATRTGRRASRLPDAQAPGCVCYRRLARRDERAGLT